MKTRFWHALLVTGTIGCSPVYVPPALGPEHPANVSAPEAPPPPASTVLAGEPALSPPTAECGEEPGARDPRAMRRTGSARGDHGAHGGHR